MTELGRRKLSYLAGEECKRDIATTVLDAIDEFLKQQVLTALAAGPDIGLSGVIPLLAS